jgi:transposase
MDASLPVTDATAWIGLDISKDTIDACVLRSIGKPQHKTFGNDAHGHQKMLRWVQQLAPQQLFHFALEATGSYGEAVAFFLVEADQPVSVINPARVKYSGIASGQTNKTDKASAQVIADYCRMHKPPLWRMASPEVRLLRALVRRLEDLQGLLHQEKNRASVPGLLPAVTQSLEASQAFLESQMQRLQEQIDRHIDSTPSLKGDRELLESIPGVGSLTAQRFLAELPDVSQFASAEQAAAWAGLSPQEHRSGTSVHKRTRLSKAGNKQLRKAFYLPAVCAIRHNPFVRALYERLTAAGKSRMAAVGAAMRKLLMLCYGVLKHQQKFSADWKKPVEVSA